MMLRWFFKWKFVNIRNWNAAGADVWGHSQALSLKLWCDSQQ